MVGAVLESIRSTTATISAIPYSASIFASLEALAVIQRRNYAEDGHGLPMNQSNVDSCSFIVKA